MKEFIRKTISIFAIMLMMVNSSLLLVISSAVEAVQNIIDESKINAVYELNLEKYVNFKVGDSAGLMIQTNLKTGIEYEDGHEYNPLSSTGIILNTPRINDEYPENIEIVAKSTKATNGDDSGKDFNFVSKFNHSSCEKANKHPSNPFVITNFSPMSCLNFAGIINLPLASRECSYSPINNGHHLFPLLHHFVPLFST